MRRFTDEPLTEVLAWLTEEIAALPAGATLCFEALDPDVSAACYDGELIDGARYRGYDVWVEVAEQLRCALRTPRPAADGFVALGLRKLADATWHAAARPSGDPEKYGADTDFARIQKLEDPGFLVALTDAVDFVRLPAEGRILELGCNQGELLGWVGRAAPGTTRIGIDHSASAIAAGRARFGAPGLRLEVGDVGATGGLGRFDLVLAVNVLHSPALDGRAILRRIVQDHLTPTGGVILGFPNGRDQDHRRRYGAQVKGYARPELSVMIKDVGFTKRYLHQHRFVVTVTGKHTVLVAGRRLASGPPPD